MRRRRELSVFNMSMLDVIAGAMGAFLIVMVVLLPYYDREAIDWRREVQRLRAELSAVRERAEAAESALAEAQEQATAQRRRAEAAEAELARTFLVVYIRWGTDDQDVDLHVVDPSGAEFYYSQKTLPGRPGELSVDAINGPANEVWEVHRAEPGEYRLYALLFNRHGNPATPKVEGRVIHRDGGVSLPTRRLGREREKVPLATVTVAEDGAVSVQ